MRINEKTSPTQPQQSDNLNNNSLHTQHNLTTKLRTKNLESLTSTMTMADTTTTLSPSETAPTHIVESYHAVENRITQAIKILQGRDSHGGQPNFAAAAREFLLPVQRLQIRARWNGRPSKIQTIPGNRRLSGH